MRSRFPDESREAGAAAVEFALILPILILLVFGMIEFGRGYNAKIALTGATREGARLFALGGADDAVADDEEVRQRVRDSAPSLTPGNITVTFCLTETCTAADWVTSPGGCSPGIPTQVRATYPLTWNIPLFGAGTWTLEGIGVMRCGG